MLNFVFICLLFQQGDVTPQNKFISFLESRADNVAAYQRASFKTIRKQVYNPGEEGERARYYYGSYWIDGTDSIRHSGNAFLDKESVSDIPDIATVNFEDLPIEILNLRNPQYHAFFKVDSVLNGTVLDWVKKPEAGFSLVDRYHELYMCRLTSGTYLDDAKKNKLTVINFEDSKLENIPVKRVVFLCESLERRIEVTAYFDIKSGVCCRNVSRLVDDETQPQVVTAFEFANRNSETPIPTRCTISAIKDGKVTFLNDSILQDVQIGETQPNDMFYLSHYGLPEPEWFDERKLPQDYSRYYLAAAIFSSVVIISIGTLAKLRIDHLAAQQKQLKVDSYASITKIKG